MQEKNNISDNTETGVSPLVRNLIDIMALHRWNQTQLGKALGVQQSTISMYLRGEIVPGIRVQHTVQRLLQNKDINKTDTDKNDITQEITHLKIELARAAAKGEAYERILDKLLERAVVTIEVTEGGIARQLKEIKSNSQAVG
jgi:transcriptional regulator with XRE-family HTH domain